MMEKEVIWSKAPSEPEPDPDPKPRKFVRLEIGLDLSEHLSGGDEWFISSWDASDYYEGIPQIAKISVTVLADWWDRVKFDGTEDDYIAFIEESFLPYYVPTSLTVVEEFEE